MINWVIPIFGILEIYIRILLCVHNLTTFLHKWRRTACLYFLLLFRRNRITSIILLSSECLIKSYKLPEEMCTCAYTIRSCCINFHPHFATRKNVRPRILTVSNLLWFNCLFAIANVILVKTFKNQYPPFWGNFSDTERPTL